MIKFDERTPDSIHKEWKNYTKEGVIDLAKYLDTWMANEHNGRNFKILADEMFKDRCEPYIVARALFGSALDWLLYGN